MSVFFGEEADRRYYRCEFLLLAGGTLSASRSKAVVAINVVAANGRLLDFLRIHTLGQKRALDEVIGKSGITLKAAATPDLSG